MMRRQILQLGSAAAAGTLVGALACPVPTRKSAAKARIRAICFDVLTIFDPRWVIKVAEAIFAGDAAEICTAWRTRQFEYSWLRASAGRYLDFRTVTAEALTFVLRDRKLTLSNEQHER